MEQLNLSLEELLEEVRRYGGLEEIKAGEITDDILAEQLGIPKKRAKYIIEDMYGRGLLERRRARTNRVRWVYFRRKENNE